jgi:hypothetical protein
MLLDSWFYQQGIDAGVRDWIARPDVLPHGMRWLHDQTSMNFQLHNRYWAADNVYAKNNGGLYDFLTGNTTALPVEEAFWDFLLGRAKNWGMSVYEQDWLHNEFERMHELLQNATLARMWLLQMGHAAQRLVRFLERDGMSIGRNSCSPVAMTDQPKNRKYQEVILKR